MGQQDFWQAVGNPDALPYWKQLAIPVLVVYGEADTNVNSAESAARLRGLAKPNIEVIVYPESGHAIEAPPDQGDSIFRKDALERIAEFIKAQ